MPVKWDAENQAKLLRYLFEELDIKVSADVLKKIAAKFGPECTPKALTHQIAKFRSGTSKAGGEDEGAATPKKRASPTKGAKSKTSKASKKTASAESDSEGDESPAKRVKTEVKSEIKTEENVKDEDDDGDF